MDRPTALIHEFTHLAGVYSPATRDIDYTIEGTVKLKVSDALANAPSFAYLSQGKRNLS